METIKSYLNNMFSGLPKTARMEDLKNNILSNMEDKYNELKNQGKTENEAIGVVISEFGNIDELINELGIYKDGETKSLPVVTHEEVDSYLNVKRTMGIQIGIGVFLCIIAPAILILLSGLAENGVIFSGLSGNAKSMPGLIALFLFITAAVGIFIYSGMNFERYKYMELGVQLPNSLEASLRQNYNNFTPKFYLSIITGVCLIIISPITLFIVSLMNGDAQVIGVVIMLIIIATAVFLFVYSGTIRESYERLLKVGDYTPKVKKEDKIIGAVAAIVWPLAVIIFLFSGFIYGLWSTAWIVFPITGLLFAMFSAAYSIITGNNEH